MGREETKYRKSFRSVWSRGLPSQDKTLGLCWTNAGTTSKTVTRRWYNIGSTPCACWVGTRRNPENARWMMWADSSKSVKYAMLKLLFVTLYASRADEFTLSIPSYLCKQASYITLHASLLCRIFSLNVNTLRILVPQNKLSLRIFVQVHA